MATVKHGGEYDGMGDKVGELVKVNVRMNHKDYISVLEAAMIPFRMVL